jgi:hypothetical protein
MSDVITIAEAVVKHLPDYDAELQFAPEFELAELETKRCVVVPISFEQINVARNLVTNQYRVDIGIMQRGKDLDIALLLKNMQELCRRFARFNVGTAVCSKVENAPLYDAELLRQRNQFASILTLHFKESGNV